jgi:ADP-heptose:LPS heptosyltransferase
VNRESTEVFFGLGGDDVEFAEAFFSETFEAGQIVVGISPGGNWPSRKCDTVKLSEIGDAILDAYDARLLLIWGPGERDEVDEIGTRMRNPAVLAPPTDITQSGALISRCSLLISNNSGPMHISAAVGTPVLSLEGPVDPVRQGPYGKAHGSVRLDELDCIGCNLGVCPRNHECFLQLPVSRVMDAIASIIEKNGIPLPKK